MLTLDLTKPSLVLAGAWNPAIFDVRWSARYLFGFTEGDEIDVSEVHAHTKPHQPPTIIHLFPPHNIGISVTTERFTIYLPDSKISAEKSEEVIERLLSSLPHTPIRALGVNFQFIIDHPTETQADLLATNEHLDQHKTLLSTVIKSQVREDDCTLNLERGLMEDSLRIDFNYHHSMGESSAIASLIKGNFYSKLKRSLQLIDSVYGAGTDYQETTLEDFRQEPEAREFNDE